MSASSSARKLETDTGDRFFFRPWNPAASELAIAKGSGPFLQDSHGKRYFDLTSGAFNVSLGYSNRMIIGRINAQLRELPYVHPSFAANVRSQLSRLLVQVSGQEFTSAFICCGGSEAVEAAIAFSRHFSKKHKLVCFREAYHGSSGVSALIGRNSLRTDADAEVLCVDPPYCFRCAYGLTKTTCGLECAEALQKVVMENRDDVCAIVVEPIIGINGVVVVPDEYLRVVRQISSKYDVVLIYDEVLTGFYRTGRCFAYQYSGATPDLLCTGKGMNSGYAPIGAVLLSEKISNFIRRNPMDLGTTNMGHPISCAASVATIESLRNKETRRSIAQISKATQAFCERIEREMPRFVVDVRGKGCLFALELCTGINRDRLSEERMLTLLALLAKRGVIINLEPTKSVVPIAPPLNSPKQDFAVALKALGDALTMLRMGIVVGRF